METVEEEDEQSREERHQRALARRRRMEQEEAPLEQEDLEGEADEVLVLDEGCELKGLIWQEEKQRRRELLKRMRKRREEEVGGEKVGMERGRSTSGTAGQTAGCGRSERGKRGRKFRGGGGGQRGGDDAEAETRVCAKVIWRGWKGGDEVRD